MIRQQALLLLLLATVFAQNNYNSNNPYTSTNNDPYSSRDGNRDNNQPYGQSNNQNQFDSRYGNQPSDPRYGNSNSNQQPFDSRYGSQQPNDPRYGSQQPNDPRYGNQQPNDPRYGSNNNNQQFDSRYGPQTNQPFDTRYGPQGSQQFDSRYGPQTGNQPQYNTNTNTNTQYGNQGQFGTGVASFGLSQPLGSTPGDSNCCEDYCYSTDEEPYTHFGTKTAYDSLKSRSNQQHVVPDCNPVQFWTIVRQGTSYPAPDRIAALRNLKKVHDDIVQNHEERRSWPDKGRLCSQDYNLVKRWFWNDSISENKGNALTPQGIEELKLLARRYKAKYSQILQGNYDERSYYFQYTGKDRVQDSYQAYVEGLFGPDSFRVHANIQNDDMFNKPYQNCNSWSRSQQTYFTDRDRSEYDHFLEKQEYIQMIRDVFRKLGFKFISNPSIVNDIYDMCRYEKAWNVNQRSPWCAAFSKNHLKLLEYAEDLKHYFKNGYGNPNSKKIGCGPLKDFYERFEKTVNGVSDGNKGTFHFTESSTFEAFLTALGVSEDYQQLRADNFFQNSKRKWQTSLIDPFGANFVASLYECRGNERYKVMFFLNEDPVEFSECDVGLCDWSTIQRKFEAQARNCNVDDFCGENSASTSHISYLSILLLISAVFFFRL